MTPIGEHVDPRDPAARASQPARDARPSPSASIASSGAGEDGDALAPARASGLWWEILAVLCVAVVPHLWGAIGHRLAGWKPQGEVLRLWDWWSLCGHVVGSVVIALPVLFIARRGGMGWRELGIVRPRAIDGISVAILTLMSAGTPAVIGFVGSFVDPAADGYAVHLQLEQARQRADALSLPLGEALLLHGLIVLAQLANGVAEEAAMRSYLLTRLRTATGSLTWAVLGSTIAFTAYHSRYPAPMLLGVFSSGIVFAAGFLVTRNLWVVALAHALGNLWLEYA